LLFVEQRRSDPPAPAAHRHRAPMKSPAQRKAASVPASLVRATPEARIARGLPLRRASDFAFDPLPRLPAAEGGSESHLRVSTYNIHKGVLRDYTGFRRVARIHELRTRLHELESDLIFLQEVQGQHQRHARRFAHWPSESQDVFLSRSPGIERAF